MSLSSFERKQYILNLINLEGKVRSDELVEKLQVSFETVRRTMEELEKEQKLKRVYGGAVKITLDRTEPEYEKREFMFVQEKRRIGREAAALVQDNDVIMIDDGTTTLQLIHYLMGKKNVTVITHGFPALRLLRDYKHRGLFEGDIIFLGGAYDEKNDRVSGVLAERMLDCFHVNKSFISIDGIQLRKGITGFHAERGNLVRKVMEHSEQSIIMTDSSKIGVVTLYKIADLREVDIVISDVAAPAEWVDELNESDTAWIHAQ